MTQQCNFFPLNKEYMALINQFHHLPIKSYIFASQNIFIKYKLVYNEKY